MWKYCMEFSNKIEKKESRTLAVKKRFNYLIGKKKLWRRNIVCNLSLETVDVIRMLIELSFQNEKNGTVTVEHIIRRAFSALNRYRIVCDTFLCHCILITIISIVRQIPFVFFGFIFMFLLVFNFIFV